MDIENALPTEEIPGEPSQPVESPSPEEAPPPPSAESTPPEVAAASPGEMPATEEEPPPPPPESKARRFFRRLIRGLLAVLIIFGAGFAAALYTVYQPATNEAQGQAQELRAQLQSAEEQIAQLQQQVDDLQSKLDALQQSNDKLSAQNEELQAMQSSYELRIALLNARLDVASATIALTGDDPAGARLALEQTDQTLATIGSLLPPAQQEVATSLQQRLALILEELDGDTFAAASDLSVLAKRLLEIEDALFGAP
ncbi:MAG: hypothetical protein D6803_03715 [Anaerolineae bacterium]|nr:MAG: hypothetical protein D6803_03715 [Anaerolineae bacterium]